MKKGTFYVVVQFGLLIGLTISATKPPKITSYMIATLAVLIAVMALLSMTKRTFSITPEITPGAELSTTGAYRNIRHPMYTALMLLGLAMLIQDFTKFRLALYIGLIIILMIKAKYEENLLIEHYRQYRAYMIKTKRFIPKVF